MEKENYKYSLMKKGKYPCPHCQKKTYVLYQDNETGLPVHETVGKCDRENNCHHEYTPWQYFRDRGISNSYSVFTQTKPTMPPPAPPSYIEFNIFNKTLCKYEQNNFAKFLFNRFGEEVAKDALLRYNVGTTRDGSTIFWLVDSKNRTQTGEIIKYNADNGKRIKGIPPNWVHSILKRTNPLKCPFGEHLLKEDKTKRVNLVEGAKSAIIGSIYMPERIWVACCGVGNFKRFIECTALQGRNVRIYPDLGMFENWSQKAKELEKYCKVTVSDLLETNATQEERSEGLDIADYLLRFSPADFNSETIKKPAPVDNTQAPEEVHTPTVDNTQQQPTVMIQQPLHPAVASMVAKNPALTLLINTFELTLTGIESKPLPSFIELKQLAAQLPDFDAFTEDQMRQTFSIDKTLIKAMIDSNLIYYISLTQSYCRAGCTPF